MQNVKAHYKNCFCNLKSLKWSSLTFICVAIMNHFFNILSLKFIALPTFSWNLYSSTRCWSFASPVVDPIKLFFLVFFLRRQARPFYYLLIFAICNKHSSLPAKNKKKSSLVKKKSFIRSAPVLTPRLINKKNWEKYLYMFRPKFLGWWC